MKLPFHGTLKYVPTNLPDTVKDELLKDKAPRYMWTALPQPVHRIGRDFPFIVAHMKLSSEFAFESCGNAVLCETEAEAKESMELLSNRAKEPVVFVQWPGSGAVGKITNAREFIHEVSVRCRTAEEGKKEWFAFERDIDRATGEVTVLQRYNAIDEADANRVATQWQAAYQKQKDGFFEAVEKSKIPLPPPARCSPLTATDLNDDLPDAKWEAMKRQWPHTFAVFEKQRVNPGVRISDLECEDAYLLDLVERGYDPKNENIRCDLQLCSALAEAAQKFARPGKRKTTDFAIYLIAFNWELGWCYLSDSEIAAKLSHDLKMPFSSEQVEKYRYRTLGLVSKRPPGPSPKLP
jgi:hypothetical protein